MTSRRNRITEKQKEIIKKLRADNYSYAVISKVMELNINTVKSICRRKDIPTPALPRKTKSEKAELHICKECGKPIDNPWNRPVKRFCSSYCRYRYWEEHNQPQPINRARQGDKMPQDLAGLPAPSELSLDARR